VSEKLFKVPVEWSKNSYVNKSAYEAKYKESIENNEKFWADEGKRIHWFKPYTKVKEVTYSSKKKFLLNGSMTEQPMSLIIVLIDIFQKEQTKQLLFLKGMIQKNQKILPINN